MHLGKLLVYFDTSPALRLLRSPNAPFIVHFLDSCFKQQSRISVPHSELLAALIRYQEDLRESHPDRFQAKAESYLSEWSSTESLWLRRSLEAQRDEPLYQLTPHTEDVFIFLDRVLDRDLAFVGTESRLKLVIETLSDLVIGASDDPDERLAHLRDEQQQLQEEIDQIEANGLVKTYQPAQIRERFVTAVSLLRQLQGDFRAVEESFRQITFQVQQRQAHGGDTRGGILEFALDAEDVLKREDQGVSFYEFVKLVLSPRETERLERVIQEVRRIPELSPHQDGLDTVRGMVSLLQAEADKVMRTNQRLSATLRRLLDRRAHAERQQVAGLLREIRGYAAMLASDPPANEIAMALDLQLAVESPFRRTFWAESQSLEDVELTDYEADPKARLEAFERLAAMPHLDWKEMRLRIQHIVSAQGSTTLGKLLRTYPAASGVIEVLGYLQIARDDAHLVNRTSTETLVVVPRQKSDRHILLTVPLVTFISERRQASAERTS